jgi:hypothetical protein
MNEQEYELAFQEGFIAARMELGIGNNPYSPTSEPHKYEAWLDGWSRFNSMK